MKAVGLRELKNRLAEYVREVRSGNVILITDRGHVVAELKPPGLSDAALDQHPGLASLARRGLIRPGAPNDSTFYPKLPRVMRRTTSAELLDAERGSR